uniref:AsIV-cont00039-ORF1 n=1 Tax=Apophua simplicipes ichnovirus TaxID=1329648 RepID=S5DMI9_9VIRU|nr:AsIV-cont00039-ORF1 [Apophua simplicipes ichnovirus]
MSITMKKYGLSSAQQTKLDDLVRDLNRLNAEIESFRVHQTLTFTNEIRSMAANIKRKRVIKKMQRLLKKSTIDPMDITKTLQ